MKNNLLKTMGIKKYGSITKGINGTNFFRDTDKDGVINIFDCRPKNPKMQDVEPNQAMAEEIKNLPIYVTEEPYEVKTEDDEEELKKKRYHILSKEAKQKAPTARKRLLSIIKKNPGVVGEVKRSNVGELTYTTQPSKEKGLMGIAQAERYLPEELTDEDVKKPKHRAVVYGGATKLKEKELKKGKENMIRIATQHYLDKGYSLQQSEILAKQDIDRVGYKIAYSRSDTIGHELEHVKQFNKVVELYHKKGVEPARRYAKRLRKGEYKNRLEERQARQAGKKLVGKRFRTTYGAQKYATKQLSRIVDRNDDMGLI